MTTPTPLVSIVTPSFNQARFLEETLLSVQRQDYPRIEHVVVDGGSTDGSVEIIRRHEKSLAAWVSEPDAGQSDALAKGFALSSGEVLAWVNSDDLLLPSAVSTAVRALFRGPALGLVYGDRLEIDAAGAVIGSVRLPSHRDSMFRRNCTIPQETAFFRRSAYDAAGGVDRNLRFAMDFDLWVRMAAVARMLHLPVFLGCYRRHEASKSVEVADESAGAAFAAEAAAVYHKHFGGRPPSRPLMRWYRLLRKARLAAESIAPARRRERASLIAERESDW